MNGDSELDAMSIVSGALSSLDENARGRVLRWAAERYGVGLGDVQRGRTPSDSNGDTTPDDSSTGLAGEGTQYKYFAELFSAANPSNESDKALVAGYWVQILQGSDNWSAR